MQRNKRLLKVKKARKKKRLRIRDSAKVAAAKAIAKRSKPIKSKAKAGPGGCTGLLKSGKPCTRKADRTFRGKRRCWQHAK